MFFSNLFYGLFTNLTTRNEIIAAINLSCKHPLKRCHLRKCKEDEQYLLGMFMVGAYQEILGDLHNLFGDTDSVHVELTDDGSYKLTNIIKGDTVADVLRYVQFDAKKLIASYTKQLAKLDMQDGRKDELLDELKAGVYGYTYFED